MILKDILNDVLGQSAFLEQDTFFSPGDIDAKQMVSFANRAAHEMREFWFWNTLRKSHQVTLVDGTLAYDLPDDFDFLITESMWKAMGARHVVIPTSDRYWAFIQAGNPGTRINYYAKFIGNKLTFTAVKGGDQINYDYQSNLIIKDINGSLKTRFTADTDEFLLNDSTLSIGIKGYWKAEKEMPSGEVDKIDFMNHLKTDVSRDTPTKNIRPRDPDASQFPYAPPVSADYLW